MGIKKKLEVRSRKLEGKTLILFLLTSNFLLSTFTSCTRDTYLTTSDGIGIAYEYEPAAVEKGTVVLLHGLGSDLAEWYTLIKHLNQNGWSTLALDFRGHGLSTDWQGRELDWRNFSNEGRKTMLRDIGAAMRFLEDKKNIWLAGSSLGANLAINYAAQDPAVRGLILLSPGFNYGGIESQPAMERYGARPVLMAGSEDDPGTLKICGILHDLAAGPKKLVSYKEAGHGAAMLVNEDTLKEEILQWMNQP